MTSALTSQSSTPATLYRHTLHLAGRAWIMTASEKGLCKLAFEHEDAAAQTAWLNRHAPGHRLVEDSAIFDENGATELLTRYFAREAVSFKELPLDLWGTSFQCEVWRKLADIPYGQVWSYKDLAEALGKPLATRAVGTANGRNPLPVILPCHRVIGMNGTLTGYAGGLALKQELLKLEGIHHVGAAGHKRFAF